MSKKPLYPSSGHGVRFDPDVVYAPTYGLCRSIHLGGYWQREGERTAFIDDVRGGGVRLEMTQGYLAHENHPPP